VRSGAARRYSLPRMRTARCRRAVRPSHEDFRTGRRRSGRRWAPARRRLSSTRLAAQVRRVAVDSAASPYDRLPARHQRVLHGTRHASLHRTHTSYPSSPCTISSRYQPQNVYTSSLQSITLRPLYSHSPKWVFIATQLNSTQLTQLNSVQPSQSCFCL